MSAHDTPAGDDLDETDGLSESMARLVETYGAGAVIRAANDADRPGLWDDTDWAAVTTHRYLWGDDTEVISDFDPRHPFSFFVERAVDAFDCSPDRVDTARRLISAIETMIEEWPS